LFRNWLFRDRAAFDVTARFSLDIRNSWRHTHASELLSRCADPDQATRTQTSTLSIYAHALEADELAAAKIWDDAMALCDRSQ
jgi:hypothetical protein